MVTLRDVARRAEVSVSTASRILSNSTKAKFAEETQIKVLQASLELGYHANFAARALASGKSHIIGVVFPRFYDTPFTALASLHILAGIENFCSQNGYYVLLSSPHMTSGTVDINFMNMLAAGYADGLIIDGHFAIDALMEAIRQAGLPAVVLGYHPHPYYLRGDNFLGGRLLMEHALALGHRRIGIIGLPDGISPAADQRLAGMRAAASAQNLAFEALPRVNGRFSADGGAQAAADLLAAQPDLTALIALNDRMAMGAIRRLQAQGWQVPQQISVMGYDDLPQAREFNPPLTTVSQQLDDWGALAMNMLVQLMDGQEPEPVVLPPKLVARQSTAPAPLAQTERVQTL
jgi:LacI family transcriptional regulator